MAQMEELNFVLSDRSRKKMEKFGFVQKIDLKVFHNPKNPKQFLKIVHKFFIINSYCP